MRLRLSALLVCLMAAAAWADDSSRPPIPVGGQAEDFPVHGLNLTPPPGWVRDSSAGGNRVARWFKADAKGNPDTFLEVNFSRSSMTNAQEWQYLTRELRASSLRTVQTGGDIEGAWVKGNFESAGVTASQMFVVTREGTRYSAALIRKNPPAAETAAADDAMMQDFIVHWRWRELEEPSAHLALLKKPVPVMGGLIRMSMPAVGQLVQLDDAATHVQYQITNLKSHSAELIVEMNLKNTPMPDMQQVGKIVKEKLKLDEELEWTVMPGKGSISQWVKTTRDGNSYWVLFGGIKIDETHSILVSCTLYRSEAAVQRAYWDSVKEVVKSVAVGGAKSVP